MLSGSIRTICTFCALIAWSWAGDAYGAAWQEHRQAGFSAFQSGDYPAAVEELEAALALAEEGQAGDQDLAILLENLTTAYLSAERYRRAQVSIHRWDRILTANEGRAWATEHRAVRDELASLASKGALEPLDLQVAPAAGVAQPPSEQDPQTANLSAVYAVHLASAKARENAVAAWEGLKRHYPDLLAGKRLTLTKVNLGDRGVFFRVLAFPFQDAEGADSVCQAMQRHEQFCAVVSG